MLTKQVTVGVRFGIHDRPVVNLVQKANEFKSAIWFESATNRVNAKSLLGLISLALTTGSEIIIKADGEDEDIAIQTLSALVIDS